jgi:2-polyprenyl-3-methyl-5-hydroxy-6-metoxy-1,4-benzoquinol methylase
MESPPHVSVILRRADMTYRPDAIAAYFDALGAGEWERFDRTLGDRVSLAQHTALLERYVRPGDRILDVGAGPGRFTEILHRQGARVVVADLSARQLELNRETARVRGFASSVEAWRQLDICDLGALDATSFDGVVAFGGPFSYVFERRDEALAQCIRVLRPGGYLALSVMSLWGTLHRHRAALRDMPRAAIRAIIATGDLTAETDPTSKHYCHMYRAAELRTFLTRPGLTLEQLSASSALATGVESEFITAPQQLEALLDYEAAACVEPGYLDAGTHLLAAVRRDSVRTI